MTQRSRLLLSLERSALLLGKAYVGRKVHADVLLRALVEAGAHSLQVHVGGVAHVLHISHSAHVHVHTGHVHIGGEGCGVYWTRLLLMLLLEELCRGEGKRVAMWLHLLRRWAGHELGGRCRHELGWRYGLCGVLNSRVVGLGRVGHVGHLGM